MKKSFVLSELIKHSEARYVYAGFWIRALGWLLDTLILTLLLTPIFISLMTLGGFNIEMIYQTRPTVAQVQLATNFSLVFLAYVIPLLIQWLYFALQQSSKYQATLGMRVFGLKVICDDGNPLSFGRATGRYFASFISGFILYIGYIMAAFTPRKQTLHDIIAGTYVIRKIEV